MDAAVAGTVSVQPKWCFFKPEAFQAILEKGFWEVSGQQEQGIALAY